MGNTEQLFNAINNLNNKMDDLNVNLKKMERINAAILNEISQFGKILNAINKHKSQIIECLENYD